MHVVTSSLLTPLISEFPDITFTVWDSSQGDPLDETALRQCELYIPTYMSPAKALEVTAKMPNLRVIQLLSAGVDASLPHVPPGVLLCNAKGVHDASTAELTLALILSSVRRIPTFVRNAINHHWKPFGTRSLADSRVAIVGYGSVGRAIEARLEPFEVSITKIARQQRGDILGLDQMFEVLGDCDVVIMVVPLTADTRGMVNDDFIDAMKPGALLVNVARGPVVDTDALIRALAARKIYAALDVTDPEPLPTEHPLWDYDNCLISPHVGGNTSAFLPRAIALVRENLRRFQDGSPLLNVIEGDY